MKISLNYEEGFAEDFRQLAEALGSTRDLNKVIATGAAQVTEDYLIALNSGRHPTAERLGARPTQHYAKSARALEYGFDDKEAYLELPAWTGLSRAFGPVDITPKNGKKYLTIPAHRLSYGRSAREFKNLKFVNFGKAAALVAEAESTMKPVVMYWLVEGVTIPQDRTVLPSDELYGQAIEEGAGEWLEIIIAENGGLTS